MTPQKYVPLRPVHRPGGAYLTVKEVARELRVAPMTVYRRIHAGELSAIRVGRGIRVPERALDAYIRGADTSGWKAEE